MTMSIPYGSFRDETLEYISRHFYSARSSQYGFNNVRRNTNTMVIDFRAGIKKKLSGFLIVNLNTCSLQATQCCPVDIVKLIIG